MPADDDLAGQAGQDGPGDQAGPVATAGSGSAADDAAPAAAAATGVVPDLMATPVFAELKIPDPDTGRAVGTGEGPDPAGQKPGPSLPHGARLAGLLQSRRGPLIAAPVAASALVAGIVFLAFPGYNNLLGQGRAQAPSASKVGSRSTQSGGLGSNGSSAPGGNQGSGGNGSQPGSHPPSGGPSPGGRHHGSAAPGSPGPSSAPSSPGGPTPASPSSGPSGSPSPTPTSTPSPTASSPPPSGPKLPPGCSWERVTAKSAGTTAGFRLAAPSSWLLTPGCTR